MRKRTLRSPGARLRHSPFDGCLTRFEVPLFLNGTELLGEFLPGSSGPLDVALSASCSHFGSGRRVKLEEKRLSDRHFQALACRATSWASTFWPLGKAEAEPRAPKVPNLWAWHPQSDHLRYEGHQRLVGLGDEAREATSAVLPAAMFAGHELWN